MSFNTKYNSQNRRMNTTTEQMYNNHHENDMYNGEDASVVIYIPRVAQEHAYLEYIRRVFHNKNIGWVARIDFEWRRDGSSWKTATVYLREWYDSERAWNVWDKLCKGKSRKLFYDSKTPWWYWLLLKCKNPCKPAVPESLSRRLDRLEGTVARMSARCYEYEYKVHTLQNRLEKAMRVAKEASVYAGAMHRGVGHLKAMLADKRNTVSHSKEANTNGNKSACRKVTANKYTSCDDDDIVVVMSSAK